MSTTHPAGEQGRGRYPLARPFPAPGPLIGHAYRELDIALNGDDAARKAAGDFQDILGRENYFLELMDHGLSIENRVRDGLLRLAGMVGYLAVHLLVVGTLAFWFSTATDAPLAAVGGAVAE